VAVVRDNLRLKVLGESVFDRFKFGFGGGVLVVDFFVLEILSGSSLGGSCLSV